MLMRFEVPLWIPTTNTYYRNYRGRMLLSKRGRAFQEAGKLAINYMGEPLVGRLGVKIVLHPPDRVRRDIDNHIKAAFDLLTKSGVWEDDSQVDVLHVKRGEIVKKGRFTVEIWQLLEKH